MNSSNDSKVKALLQETILTLCRGSINFKTELRIEAVIGITIDRDKVLLVSLHKTEKPLAASIAELSKASAGKVADCSGGGSSSAKSRGGRAKSNDESIAHSSATFFEALGDISTAEMLAACGRFEYRGDSSASVLGEPVTAADDSRMHCDDDDDVGRDVKPIICAPDDGDDDDGLATDGEQPLPGDDASAAGDSADGDESGDLLCSVEDDSGETVLTIKAESNSSASGNQCRTRSSSSAAAVAAARAKRAASRAPYQMALLPFNKRIEAIRLYEKLGSTVKVAKILGVGDGQIRNILKQKDELLAHAERDAEGLEYSIRKKSLPFRKRVEAIHLYDVLRSTKKVAKHFGVGPTQIRDILKRRRELLSMAGEEDSNNEQGASLD